MLAHHALAPERPARVLIVDDSVVVRGLVSRWIAAAPGLEVAGTVCDGQAALDALPTLSPDVVLLDLDMPGLDGITALPLLLRARPGLSVIVVSTLTERNAAISLRCLALGAVDYLPKPSSLHELSLSRSFQEELVRAVSAIAARPGGTRVPAMAPAPPPALKAGPRALVRAILIGASTGGPRAVIDTLKHLPPLPDRPPILVVQHMPPIFTTVFADQIRSETGFPAREGRDGEAIERGTVYVAPGGRHMGIRPGASGPTIRIDDGPPIRHCRPAVDVLFRDAAVAFGSSALALVLTGMGQDGLDGARDLAASGATIMVQDQATSTVWGMPGSIAKAGLADMVLPLDRIPGVIASLLGADRGRGQA